MPHKIGAAVCSKIKPFFTPPHPKALHSILHAMLCSGDPQERSEAVQRMAKLEREGDEGTQLGGGGVRPPWTPAVNTSADKLAELIDWTEGLRTLSPVLQSSQSLGLRD